MLPRDGRSKSPEIFQGIKSSRNIFVRESSNNPRSPIRPSPCPTQGPQFRRLASPRRQLERWRRPRLDRISTPIFGWKQLPILTLLAKSQLAQMKRLEANKER